MHNRFVSIQLFVVATAFAIGLLASSMTSAEVAPARTCQWTYLVDHDEPEIVGFEYCK